MKLASPEQMKWIDSYTIKSLGIPGIVLMENAALRVAGEAEKILAQGGKRIVLLAGKGNNGGDAFAVARILYGRGYCPRVYLLAAKEGVAGDAKINLDILDKLEMDVVCMQGEKEDEAVRLLEADLLLADLVIDGIFGTGFKGCTEGLAATVIEMVNQANAPVISIDIPSGLDGDTGKVSGPCVNADRTVTFCLPKKGLILGSGPDYTGELVTADIGIPPAAVHKAGIEINLVEQKYVSGLLPERKRDSNKGDYGKVFIISGSIGMTGAGRLCSMAALRTGSGLAYLGVPAGLAAVYSSAAAEPVVIPLEDEGTGRLSESCLPAVLDRIGKMDVLAIGPGLSVSAEIFNIVKTILKNSPIPMVLDADALNAAAQCPDILLERKAEAIITPHPGEMARLIGVTAEDVQKDRIAAARDFAAKWGVITVLKGSRTVIAIPDGTVYINSTGNPGMATAGSGDVLTGIIASLVGQGMRPKDAAVAGVYIHGLAGDMAVEDKGVRGMIAGDIIEALPQALKLLGG
jgi:hydroxyethylthiazole kinase-like uncharacterized protein yjeF